MYLFDFDSFERECVCLRACMHMCVCVHVSVRVCTCMCVCACVSTMMTRSFDIVSVSSLKAFFCISESSKHPEN